MWIESGSVTRFFGIFFMNRTHLGSDEKVRMVSLKNSFRGDIREISDFAHAYTARSFAGINSVFALKDNTNFFFYTCELLQHSSTFFLAF